MNYKIYRLCRDQGTIKSLEKQETLFSLPKTEYVTGIDMYTFINNIITNTGEDYVLISHDDVILPIDIGEHIEKSIKSTNSFLGKDNWAVIGNAGIQVLTKKVLHYLTDPNIKIIPPYTSHPDLVESIDGNTMLLNIKNLREKNVFLPKSLSGFHLYDIILCLEAQKKGLLCAVSSHLFVTHLSGGNRQAFVEAWNTPMFQDYFSKNFKNQSVSSLNGDILIYKNLKDSSVDIDQIFKNNLIDTFKDKKFTLNILQEDAKNNLSELKEKIDKNITLNILTGESIEKLVKKIEEKENSFSMILRSGDALSNDFIEYLQFMMFDSSIIVGNTVMNGKHMENASNIYNIYTGKREYPTNLTIYNSKLLKNVFNEITLNSNILDDYLILFTASKYTQINKYPILFGERKYEEEKVDIKGYTYTTQLSQITNSNLIDNNFYNFFRDSTEKLQNQIYTMSSDYHEFASFKKGMFWKVVQVLKRIKVKITKKV